MPVDVSRRLGFDHGVLEPFEQIFGVLQTQANRLEPVTALVELQDHLIPDHGIIIADEVNYCISYSMLNHNGYIQKNDEPRTYARETAKCSASDLVARAALHTAGLHEVGTISPSPVTGRTMRTFQARAMADWHAEANAA